MFTFLLGLLLLGVCLILILVQGASRISHRVESVLREEWERHHAN